MTQTQKILFELIHKATDPEYELDAEEFADIDWKAVYKLAIAHSVCYIAFDALNGLPKTCMPDIKILAQWYGQIPIQESQYGKKWQVACSLAEFWGKKNVQAVVLKGRSIAQYYPIPSHRYSCDLDVFIENGWSLACRMLEEKGIKLVYEVYKEAEFSMDGVYVECHRFITPVRGNKTLKRFELYLRSILDKETQTCFEGSILVNPPLQFTVLLCLEHALWDFLHGVLTMKQVVDWMVLRRQNADWQAFNEICKELKFDRFVQLINSMADVMEGKVKYNELNTMYRKAFDEVMQIRKKQKVRSSWFMRRYFTVVEIVESRKRYSDFGYCSMFNFLFHAMWTHFFDKEVKL